MKTCTKCGIAKSESEFSINRRAKDGLCSRCKSCQQQYEREYRKNNPHKNKEYRNRNALKLAESQREAFKMHQEFLNSIKRPCVKCGESRLYLIQFHHVDPKTKAFEVSNKHSLKSTLVEIQKCVCLCSNCHDEFHYLYGKIPDNSVEALKEYLGCGERIVELLGGNYEQA